MTNVWPCAKTPNGGVDLATPRRDFKVLDGDLLVMSKDTQVVRPSYCIPFPFLLNSSADSFTHAQALMFPSSTVSKLLL